MGGVRGEGRDVRRRGHLERDKASELSHSLNLEDTGHDGPAQRKRNKEERKTEEIVTRERWSGWLTAGAGWRRREAEDIRNEKMMGGS